MRTLLAAVLVALALAAPAAAGPNPALLHPGSLNAKAPATYRVKVTTTKGAFVITVHRTWAPLGADRFYNLVKAGFYDGDPLFRVLPGFVVQWGISPYPEVSKAWLSQTIKDDPVRHSNTPGTVAFAATSQPNSRTTQVFVNTGSNANLDQYGFAPFGMVTSDMTALQKLYSGYGETASNDQAQLTTQGAAFVQKHFPKLDRIVSARVVG